MLVNVQLGLLIALALAALYILLLMLRRLCPAPAHRCDAHTAITTRIGTLKPSMYCVCAYSFEFAHRSPSPSAHVR